MKKLAFPEHIRLADFIQPSIKSSYLKSLTGETRVIMEHTGRYYEQIAQYLHDTGIYVSTVNPKPIKRLRNRKHPAPCENRQGRRQENREIPLSP